VTRFLKYCASIFLEDLRETTQHFSQYSRFPGRHLNPGPPEYEAGVLTTRPRRSVSLPWDANTRSVRQKFHVFYEILRFSSLLTRARHWSISWIPRYINPGHNTTPYFLILRYNLVLKIIPTTLHEGVWGERRYSCTRWGWAISTKPRLRLIPGERTPGTHCKEGWVGPRAGLDTEDRGKILSPLPVSVPFISRSPE
jgi:hypothetical protein